jgi:hypothetical protein
MLVHELHGLLLGSSMLEKPFESTAAKAAATPSCFRCLLYCMAFVFASET